MAAARQEKEARNSPPQPDSWNSDYLAGYRKVFEAVGEDRLLAWATFVYGCEGHRPRGSLTIPGKENGCGFEHRVWVCLGVEGPPDLKEAKTYIPAPFVCGQCPDCAAMLHHVRWSDDEEFAAPKELPIDVAFFSVPPLELAVVLAARNYGGANYTDPTGKTHRARPRE